MYETLCRATIRTFDLFGALAVSGLWWTACNNRCATLHRLSFIRRSCFQRHFGFVAAQCVTIFKSTTLLQQRRIQAGGGGGGGGWGLQLPLSYMVTPPLLLNSPPPPPRISYRGSQPPLLENPVSAPVQGLGPLRQSHYQDTNFQKLWSLGYVHSRALT